MRNLSKIIRRFTSILLLSFILLVLVNFAVSAYLVFRLSPSADDSPYDTAIQTGRSFYVSESGYTLPEDISMKLREHDIWAFVIDNTTMEIVWKTDNFPDTIPTNYTLADIANLSVGYLDGYPTYTGETENGIVVLGYPKDSFWKHTRPSWSYDLIAHFPQIACIVFTVNIAVILLIYVIANMKFMNQLKPITEGIQALSVGESVHIPEKGLLSDISAQINCTSDILHKQKQQLIKTETARANWISGVSHDIRTPLAMVMGYAGQLKDNGDLTEEERQKAEVIVKQSIRMQGLINDLNLASKLEYNMQPFHLVPQNLITIVRQVIVDHINIDVEGKYEIEWETDASLNFCLVNADKDLLKRAIENIIQNSIYHNEHGCKIYVNITTQNNSCMITISDNGIGATDQQIEKLNLAAWSMDCAEITTKQRHGLGLLIVKQIVFAHSGSFIVEHSIYGGFGAKIILPICDTSKQDKKIINLADDN